MAALITPGPVAARQLVGNPNCDSIGNAYELCVQETPGFSTITAASEAASCLCYSLSVWQPNVYDNNYYSCGLHLSTADPAAFSSSSIDLTRRPCKIWGNVKGATSSFTESVLLPPEVVDSVCGSWSRVIASCTRTTTSFLDLPASDRASCLCYMGTSFAPNLYDGYASTCAAYYSTAFPKYYSEVWVSESDLAVSKLCEKAGDVRATPVSMSPSTTMPPTSETAPTQTDISTTMGSASSSHRVVLLVALCISFFPVGLVLWIFGCLAPEVSLGGGVEPNSQPRLDPGSRPTF